MKRESFVKESCNKTSRVSIARREGGTMDAGAETVRGTEMEMTILRWSLEDIHTHTRATIEGRKI